MNQAENPAGFAAWCIVELMGHVTLAGYVTEAELGGGKLFRIDVPPSDRMQAFTTMFGASAIYKMTPVDEATVRAVCERKQQQPFTSWELQSAFNDWAEAKKEELKDRLREEVRRELTHQAEDVDLATGGRVVPEDDDLYDAGDVVDDFGHFAFGDAESR